MLPLNTNPTHSIHFFLLCFLFQYLILVAQCQSCGPRVSPRLLREIPCDMNILPYCTQPGSAYPWSSVRRYIYENQGFVKRMYGEQRQSQIIRDEIYRLNERYERIEPHNARNGKNKNFQENLNHETSSLNISVPGNINENNLINAGVEQTKNISKIDAENVTVDFEEVYNADETDNDYSTTTVENLSNFYFDSGNERNGHQTTQPTLTEDDENEVAEEPDKINKGYNACPITQEVVAPYWANNTRGETLALLNVYPFEQYIHWEKCAFEGEQMYCRDGCRCEQQYRLHRLLAFDPKNECRGIFADWFRFPGCCVCICYDINERINNRKARL